MKAIVIGASLSGKTTLISHLRKNFKLPFSEIDEELTRVNNGKYPEDSEYKVEVLAPGIVSDILHREDIVFFTNTDYFRQEDLKRAKQKGFKIIVLNIDLAGLKVRNIKRIENEGYGDQSQWLEGMLEYLKTIKAKGLVDKEINANKPVGVIGEELMKYFNQI